jgi:hypothetical protein
MLRSDHEQDVIEHLGSLSREQVNRLVTQQRLPYHFQTIYEAMLWVMGKYVQQGDPEMILSIYRMLDGALDPNPATHLPLWVILDKKFTYQELHVLAIIENCLKVRGKPTLLRRSLILSKVRGTGSSENDILYMGEDEDTPDDKEQMWLRRRIDQLVKRGVLLRHYNRNNSGRPATYYGVVWHYKAGAVEFNRKVNEILKGVK